MTSQTSEQPLVKEPETGDYQLHLAENAKKAVKAETAERFGSTALDHQVRVVLESFGPQLPQNQLRQPRLRNRPDTQRVMEAFSEAGSR